MVAFLCRNAQQRGRPRDYQIYQPLKSFLNIRKDGALKSCLENSKPPASYPYEGTISSHFSPDYPWIGHLARILQGDTR